MSRQLLSTTLDGIPAWRFALRLIWVAIQIYLVICVGQQGILFFYQAF
jgi:hypothetical protein